MRANERQQKILELLSNQERVSVIELAKTYAASQETMAGPLSLWPARLKMPFKPACTKTLEKKK